MRIPSKKECYRLIYESNMMEHIVVHSFQVCRVSLMIVDHIDIEGTALNRDLVQASAMLHDITKTRSFQTKESHDKTGAKFLSELGYPEVGNIVRQHVVLDEYFLPEFPTEAEIVNYSDKRVLHDQVVSLKERENYILERYGAEPIYRQRIRMLWRQTEKLEKKLFNCLPFSPAEMNLELAGTKDFFPEFLTFRSNHQPDEASKARKYPQQQFS
ncbi:MAG: HDIG domain-containing protein [Deltaproteobacteria bacterium]|nr:HDIG domain-containing protein [Deltaproteobacteria bacterium]